MLTIKRPSGLWWYVYYNGIQVSEGCRSRKEAKDVMATMEPYAIKA